MRCGVAVRRLSPDAQFSGVRSSTLRSFGMALGRRTRALPRLDRMLCFQRGTDVACVMQTHVNLRRLPLLGLGVFVRSCPCGFRFACRRTQFLGFGGTGALALAQRLGASVESGYQVGADATLRVTSRLQVGVLRVDGLQQHRASRPGVQDIAQGECSLEEMPAAARALEFLVACLGKPFRRFVPTPRRLDIGGSKPDPSGPGCGPGFLGGFFVADGPSAEFFRLP